MHRTLRHTLTTGLLLAAASGWVAGVASLTGAERAQTPSKSLRDGVFSAAQVEAGKALYAQECARCHGPTLGGGESSPALLGDEFMSMYHGLTVHALFERIRVSMPLESPGRLSRTQYVNVVAFLLAENGYPPGSEALSHEAAALQAIKIEPLRTP